ncbi:hypothetical protein LMH73_026385 [Vibrio splendidus]|nr:hypothetical protein [Vibrio splendidus]MCC4880873.1 hypothetical protein [Vibrio splendidus]
MKITSTKRLLGLAFFAGMCLAFLLSLIVYFHEPFDLSIRNIVGLLLSGGVVMLFVAIYELNKEKIIHERGFN